MDDTQKLILAELNKLGTSQAQVLERLAGLETNVAVIKSQLTANEKRAALCDIHIQRTSNLENEFAVFREKIRPLERVVYGAVALMLIALLTALLGGVIVK